MGNCLSRDHAAHIGDGREATQEKDKKPLRSFLQSCGEDMDIVNDVTTELFTEIAAYHRQGVSNLGITLDTVVCHGNSVKVVSRDLCCGIFRKVVGYFKGFERGKIRDVDSARYMILSYLKRIPVRNSLYWILLAPNRTAREIADDILSLKVPQEVSYDLATDAPSFERTFQYPRSLLTWPHRLSLVRNSLYWILLAPNRTAREIADDILSLKVPQEVSYDLATDAPSFERTFQDPRSLLTWPHRLSLASIKMARTGDLEDFVNLSA